MQAPNPNLRLMSINTMEKKNAGDFSFSFKVGVNKVFDLPILVLIPLH